MGAGKWQKHVIDDTWSQAHAMTMVDLNGDESREQDLKAQLLEFNRMANGVPNGDVTVRLEAVVVGLGVVQVALHVRRVVMRNGHNRNETVLVCWTDGNDRVGSASTMSRVIGLGVT